MITANGKDFEAAGASPQETMTAIKGLIRFLKDKGLDAYEIIGLISETVYKIFAEEGESE